MSLNEKYHFTDKLKESFDTWDAGSPTDMWDELDASLSVEKVFQRLDASLEAEGSSAYQWLKAAHNDWSPATNSDGWERMQEELSRERVWNRLNSTLATPVSTQMPWLKMAAASILFVFVSFYFSNAVQKVDRNELTTDSNISSIADQQQDDVQSTTPVVAVNNEDQQQFVNTNPQQYRNYLINNKLPQNQLFENNEQNETNQTVELHLTENGTISNTIILNDSIDRIGVIQPQLSDNASLATLRDVKLLPVRQPNWSVQLGTQVSLLNERNTNSFTNALPKAAFVADVAYTMHFGRFFVSEGLGFSQFAQTSGKYINGRYFNTNQKLNTLQLSTLGGVRFGRTSMYTGVVFSRLINGFEEKQNSVSNVYNASSIQLGLTAGFNCRVKQFTNGSQIGVGMQYQYMPRLKSSNVEFNDLQGLRLQAKFSF
ncbi:MAG: hypothetical protein IT221_02015 [Fluviicola sp.]|nr:hypothetical protein [Fluviicola sp.]